MLTATWAWDDITGLPTRIGEHSLTNGDQLTSWLPDVTSSQGTVMAETGGFNGDQWLLTDPFANTAAWAATNGQGSAFGTRSYDAFGANSTFWNTGPSTFGYAGQYTDLLVDMRARDYDPSTGQFTAADPVAQPVGMAYTNGYAYAFNNPLMHTDPTGLWSCAAGDTACQSAQMLVGEVWGVGEWALNFLNSQTPWGRYQQYTAMRDAQQDLQGRYGLNDLEYWAEGFDNQNPFGDIRDNGAAAWQQAEQGNFLNAGRSTGETLATVTVTAAPFAKGTGAAPGSRRSATTGALESKPSAPVGQIGPPAPVGQIGPGTCPAAAEAGTAATGRVSQTVSQAADWLGPEARSITNGAGDRIFLSRDGLRRIRVDINRPYPHSSPHAHVEELVDGSWVKSGPIYPSDVPAG